MVVKSPTFWSGKAGKRRASDPGVRPKRHDVLVTGENANFDQVVKASNRNVAKPEELVNKADTTTRLDHEVADRARAARPGKNSMNQLRWIRLRRGIGRARRLEVRCGIDDHRRRLALTTSGDHQANHTQRSQNKTTSHELFLSVNQIRPLTRPSRSVQSRFNFSAVSQHQQPRHNGLRSILAMEPNLAMRRLFGVYFLLTSAGSLAAGGSTTSSPFMTIQ